MEQRRHAIEPESVQKLDSVDGIPGLLKVGKAVADRKVKPEHLNLAVFRP